jgi:hypothetical protein
MAVDVRFTSSSGRAGGGALPSASPAGSRLNRLQQPLTVSRLPNGGMHIERQKELYEEVHPRHDAGR